MLRIGFIILNLIFISQPAICGANVASLLAAMALPVTPETKNIIKQNMRLARDYLRNPDPKTPAQNSELRTGLKRFDNYFRVEKTLSRCVRPDGNSYAEAILNAAATVDENRIHCGSLSTRLGSLGEPAEAILASQLQDQITQQSLVNAVDRYYHLVTKYSLSTQDMVDDLCVRSCTPEAKELIKNRLAYLRTIGQPEAANPVKVFDEINSGLKAANEALSNVKPPKDKGYIFDSPASDGATMDQYQKGYQAAFFRVLSGEDGFLVLTDTIKSQVGEIRTISSDSVEDERGNYYLRRHNLLNGDPKTVIMKAVREAKQMIIDQTRNINEMNRIKSAGEIKSYRPLSQSLDDLRRLIVTNPLSVAQVLMTNPSAAQTVCTVLKDLEQNKVSDAKWESIYLAGGVGIGALLVASGVGAAAGLTTMAAAVATASTVAGLGIGTVATAHYASKASDLYSVPSEIESAIVAGQADGKNASLSKEVLSEYYAARNEAILAGTGLVLDVGGLGVIAKIAGRAGGKSMANAVRGYSATLRKVTAAVQNNPAVKTSLSKLGTSKDKLIAYLSQVDTNTQKRFLDVLARARGNLTGLSDHIEKGVQKCLIK